MFCQFWQFFDRRKCRKNVEGKCQKIQAKKKLGQKLSQKLSQKFQQIPSKNRFKIQNNNPKNGAGALAPAPFLGRAPLAARALLFWILYRFFVGICWSFWLSFWPSFLWPGFFDIFLRRFFFSTFSSVKKLSKLTKKILAKNVQKPWKKKQLQKIK